MIFSTMGETLMEELAEKPLNLSKILQIAENGKTKTDDNDLPPVNFALLGLAASILKLSPIWARLNRFEQFGCVSEFVNNHF